jgi:hypothetical protein
MWYRLGYRMKLRKTAKFTIYVALRMKKYQNQNDQQIHRLKL